MTLDASLSIVEAAGRLWDVIVVGAGPAGAVTARELSRLGRSVLIVDKSSFPRWKVCGCCLNGSALAALRTIGLGTLVEDCNAVPLSKFRLAAGARSAELSLPDGMALSRERFDAALLREAIRAGSHFLPETTALPHSDDNEQRTLRARHRDGEISLRGRIVIGASGLSGQLSTDRRRVAANSHLGAGTIVADAPAFYRPGTIFMACVDDGYIGFVRLEDGRLNVAAALDPLSVRRAGSPAGAAERIISRTGWPEIPNLRSAAWRGTPYLTHRTVHLTERRLFTVGDAAGYVEPFTGEGMAWGLTSAIALAPIVDKAIDRWDARSERTWVRFYGRAIGPRQRLCRTLSRVLRSHALTQLMVGALSCAPVLARPFIRHLNRDPATSERIT